MRQYYVYRLVGAKGEILYVGKTIDMSHRFFTAKYAHFSPGSHLPDACYKELADGGRVEFMECGNVTAQAMYEIWLIKKERPKYNTDHKRDEEDVGFPRSMRGKKWKAWQEFDGEWRAYLSGRADKSQPFGGRRKPARKKPKPPLTPPPLPKEGGRKASWLLEAVFAAAVLAAVLWLLLQRWFPEAFSLATPPFAFFAAMQ